MPEFSTVGDFLTTEIPRLESVREAWLDAPDPECHGRTPRSIIARERARLPESVSGHDAMIDPDCPCCQMMGELSGPTFWHLDGSDMDDEFAFDTQHRTREEWKKNGRNGTNSVGGLTRSGPSARASGGDRPHAARRGAGAIWSRQLLRGRSNSETAGIADSRYFGSRLTDGFELFAACFAACSVADRAAELPIVARGCSVPFFFFRSARPCDASSEA